MNLLQKEYNRDDFIQFLKAFLPDFKQDIRNVSNPRGLQVTEDVSYLGQSSLLDLPVFEIAHISSANARMSLAADGFRIMKDSAAYRALAVYRSEKSHDWRLSLMTAPPEINEKGKIKQTFSNPRRYSFFLGPDSKIGTPSRLLKERVADFADLQKRFSIEVVNKEFYAEIAKLFTELAGGKRLIGAHELSEAGSLELPSVAKDAPLRKEFAVRLIGRLVFCWFLKKKSSSANRPLIPEEILSSEAIAKNADYYHAILEPLFFESLNTPTKERKSNFGKKPWSEVPFLNGGLFDAHREDFYDLGPMGYSKHINTLKVPDAWLSKLLKTFELYNFTIDENTSVDVELSIDPEMLGRIFENLLAEINPETGESARKASGSYYTPRVIVDYMVDESLKSFLRTRADLTEEQCNGLLSFSDERGTIKEIDAARVIEALGKLRIIDPACGSGAFPMGILQKMLLVLRKVDPDSKRWKEKIIAGVKDSVLRRKLESENLEYVFKLGIIRDSIYGVDIQPVAMEISKLRFFLSLIVDEKIDDASENRGIQPLPNLEFKFVCANSLIPLPLSKPETNGLLFDSEDQDSIRRLKELRDDYFTSYGKKKHDLERRFREAQDKMKDFYLQNAVKPQHNLLGNQITIKTKAEPSLTQSLAFWDPFGDKPAEWFDSEWMFGVQDGFDIVIANPPYVRQEEIKKQKPALQGYECYSGTADLYVYFYERGFQLLRDGGVLSFISSNKYFRAGYGEKLREYLAAKGRVLQLIDFGDVPVFEAIAYPSIILVQRLARGAALDGHKIAAVNWEPNMSISEFPGILASKTIHVPQIALRAKGWSFEAENARKLMDKLRAAGKPLGEYVENRFYYGIKTGFNEAFVVDRETRDRLIAEDASSAKALKPYLRGKDVKRWQINFADQFLIKIESSENKQHPWSGKAEKEAEKCFAQTYPAIYKHFKNYQEPLKNRDDQGNYFWELRSCAYWKEFEEPKIVFPDIAQRTEFAWDDGKHYLVNTAYILPTKERWLMALLNSMTIFWFYGRVSNTIQGGFVRFIRQYVETIPVPTASISEKNALQGLVERIVKAKQSDSKADVSHLEHEINERVYHLYGLNKDEIQIIEQGSRNDLESEGSSRMGESYL